MNNISPPQQIKKLKDYQFMEFHPYTLKDYKELTRNPVVMGPLGANIGTKEWELKRNKMKKMMNYSNNINKEHKGIKSLKKDTPHDEIKKLTKEKIERSIRHRTYEYGKLIRTGKYKEDYEEKDFNNFNNNQNIIPEEENEDFMNKIDLNNNENNNIVINENNKSNNIEDNNIIDNNNTNNIMNENEINYGQLLKQNEEYKSKIQDIKVGDYVLTHKGRFRKVLETFKKEICNGFNFRQAKEVLSKIGWLENEQAEPKSIKNEKKRVYKITSKIWSD